MNQAMTSYQNVPPLRREDVVNDNLLFQLTEIFPDAEINFLRHLCKNKNNSDEVLQRLIAEIFRINNYPKSQDMQLAILTNLIPDADPIYLMENLSYIKTEDDLNEFVEEALDLRDYPKLKRVWAGSKTDMHINEQYTAQVNSEKMKFMNIDEDFDEVNVSYSSMPDNLKRKANLRVPTISKKVKDVNFVLPIKDTNNHLLFEMMNIFPDAEPSYMRSLCGNMRNTTETVEKLIAILFAMPSYPKSKPRQLEILENVVPDADVTFLNDSLININTEDELNDFIGILLETKNYPVKEGYIEPDDITSNPIPTVNKVKPVVKSSNELQRDFENKLALTAVKDSTSTTLNTDFDLPSTSTAPQDDFALPSTSAAPQNDFALPSTSVVSQEEFSTSLNNESDEINMEELLSVPDYPRSAKDQLDMLQTILPNADTTFLQKSIGKLTSPEELNKFIDSAMETRQYPVVNTQSSIHPKLAEVKKYTENFNIDFFLQSIPDPEKYFNSRQYSRNAEIKISSYAYIHCMSYLENKYLAIPISTIKYKFAAYKYDIIQTCKYLDTISVVNVAVIRKLNIQPLPSLDNVEIAKVFAYLTHKNEIETFIKQKKKVEKEEWEKCKAAGTLIACECCFKTEIIPKNIITCPAGSKFCKFCVEQYVQIAFADGVSDYPCLDDCGSSFTLKQLESAVSAKLLLKISQMIQIKEVKAAGIEELESCPFCDFAAIIDPTYKVFTCLNPDCMIESCRECKEFSHIPLRCDEVVKDADVQNRVYVENKMSEALLTVCRNCQRKLIKADGCNKLTCKCGQKICYVCKRSGVNYTHFNGQGGDKFNLCPLWCDIHLLHRGNVVHAAEQALAEVGQDSLETNPVADIQEHYNELLRNSKKSYP